MTNLAVDARHALDRESAAYHEAGHAVIALFHGWEISPEGVEIDERWYTGLRCTRIDKAHEGPTVIIALAGLRAESKWRRLQRSPCDDDCWTSSPQFPMSARNWPTTMTVTRFTI